MQKAGGDYHIHIGVRLVGGNVQPYAENAQHMFGVVRAVAHAHLFAHIALYPLVLLSVHAVSSVAHRKSRIFQPSEVSAR